eukprot:6297762-Prymnesium_polylepis.2
MQIRAQHVRIMVGLQRAKVARVEWAQRTLGGPSSAAGWLPEKRVVSRVADATGKRRARRGTVRQIVCRQGSK